LAKLDAEDRQVVAILAQMLASENEHFRWTAAHNLEALHHHACDAVAALSKATADSSNRVRIAAVHALGRIGVDDQATRATLGAILEDKIHTPLRLAAAESLWRLGRVDVIPALKEVLKAKASADLVGAARLLWQIDRNPLAVKTFGASQKKSDTSRPWPGFSKRRTSAFANLRPSGSTNWAQPTSPLLLV
jgi:HEAT repeat protein